MRHRNSGRQLSRNSSHRHAMLRNMATSLLRHETIRTTVPKAKELRRVVEPLITLAKIDSAAKRRLAYARLRDDAVVEKLFDDLGPRFKTRAGGYTRILKMEPRPGDSADMALMQLVEAARSRPRPPTTPTSPVPRAASRQGRQGPEESRKRTRLRRREAEAGGAEAPQSQSGGLIAARQLVCSHASHDGASSARAGRHAAALKRPAWRMRRGSFLGSAAVATTLSSMRMPPKGAALSPAPSRCDRHACPCGPRSTANR